MFLLNPRNGIYIKNECLNRLRLKYSFYYFGTTFES